MATDQSGFGGVVGRTQADSVPWWPEPTRAVAGAPNIVYLVFDDVGFSDFGCYGSEIDTPNLDRLAAGGLRYTGFHTTALCSPTRACLLTGRNHHSVGMGGLADWDLGYPGHRGRVAHSAGTLAEMLRPAGYNTFAVGKWHLTPLRDTTAAGPYEDWPTQRGFDQYYGFLEGETSQWHPVLTQDNHHLAPIDQPGYHLTQDLVDRSIGFVRDHLSVAPEKPFFLYLAFGACHAPHHVAREYVDKYVPVFEKGWDQTRADRLARQIATGIVPQGTELPPRNDGVKAWEDLGDDERRLGVRLQAAYAGMMEHTDTNIGRLLEFFQSCGLLDNTIFVVLSDNGASQEGSPVGTMNAMRYFNLVFDKVEDNVAHMEEIGEAQWNNNYPHGWAMAGNTPLRRYKQNTHGGGVRDPLIVHWPAGISDAGGVRHQFHHVSDITPTILEVLRINAPSTVGGVAQQPIDGTSLAYTFDAPADGTTRKTVQYFEMLGHRGIVHNGWKAVTFHRPMTDFDADQWELYNLAEDFAEAKDLAESHPLKLSELVERWWIEAGRNQVLPLVPAFGRFGIEVPGAVNTRSRFEYLPGMTRVATDAAPDIRNRSYTITVEITEPGDGVLISQGDSCSGYTLYVQSGVVVHDYNYLGNHSVTRAPTPLPSHGATVQYAFSKTGERCGVGRLLLDGIAVSEGEVPATAVTMISLNECLYVGKIPSPPSDTMTGPSPSPAR